jgi:hypothetical protein
LRSGMVSGMDLGAAARDITLDVAGGEIGIVLEIGQPIERPFGSKVGIGEIGRLVGFALVIRPRS